MGVSDRGTDAVVVDPRLTAYIREVFAAEDTVLAEIRERHAQAGLPDIAISPEEAKLIVVLLRAVGARRVLEVGTLGGYSGVWIARALPPGGRLVSIERDPQRAAFARESFRRANVVERVELREGEAREVLPHLAPPFDAVFLDADKEPLPRYFREAMRLLRAGGLLLCDNAFLEGRVADPESTGADVAGMREFNTLASSDPRLVSAVVPIRDGLTVAVKVGGP